MACSLVGPQRPPPSEQIPLPRWIACLTILKGMVGSAILGMPYVSSRVGLAVAVPGTAVASAITALGIWRLVECKAWVDGQPKTKGYGRCPADENVSQAWVDGQPKTKGYGRCPEDENVSQAAHPVLHSSLVSLGLLASIGYEAFGLPGAVAAGLSMLATQLAITVAYVAVITETMMGPRMLGHVVCEESLRSFTYVLLCALCMVRRLRSVALLSIAALFIYAYLIAQLAFFGGAALADGDAPDALSTWFPAHWSHLGTFWGTVVFAQEAIVIAQCVYEDMRLNTPHEFVPILSASFGMASALFAFVSIFGVMAYGDATERMFYLNFPADSAAVSSGKAVLCMVLLLSFAVQMFPVVTFLEMALVGPEICSGDPLVRESNDPRLTSNSEATGWRRMFSVSRSMQTALIRCLAVAVSCVLAAFVPSLSCITGYAGNFAISLIGFVLPAVFHTRLTRHTITWKDGLANLLLVTFGVCSFCCGMFATSCG